ncbi:hypothetical protein JG688_00016374, partial [Phytophthora aleatoria]
YLVDYFEGADEVWQHLPVEASEATQGTTSPVQQPAPAVQPFAKTPTKAPAKRPAKTPTKDSSKSPSKGLSKSPVKTPAKAPAKSRTAPQKISLQELQLRILLPCRLSFRLTHHVGPPGAIGSGGSRHIDRG